MLSKVRPNKLKKKTQNKHLITIRLSNMNNVYIHDMPIFNSEFPTLLQYELQATRITCYKLQVTSYELQMLSLDYITITD